MFFLSNYFSKFKIEIKFKIHFFFIHKNRKFVNFFFLREKKVNKKIFWFLVWWTRVIRNKKIQRKKINNNLFSLVYSLKNERQFEFKKKKRRFICFFLHQTPSTHSTVNMDNFFIYIYIYIYTRNVKIVKIFNCDSMINIRNKKNKRKKRRI